MDDQKIFFRKILTCRKFPHGNFSYRYQNGLITDKVGYTAMTTCNPKFSAGLLFKWLCVLMLASGTQVAKADCFDDAGLYHHVNPWILRAIAAEESNFRPRTVVRNSNDTVDRGMTGINSVHLPELARYGIGANDLMDACKSIYVAGWHLRKKMMKYGNNYRAVGAYHSETPGKRDIYAAKIRRRIDGWTALGWIR